ncbi:MAG: hypothetical protein F4X77_01835 [Acidobacteriia bacterium]|nr:hypothetical protein [Terriglobia bacterium]
MRAPPSQRREGIRQDLRFLNLDSFRAGALQASGGNGPFVFPRLEKCAEDCTIVEDSPEL